MPATEEYTPNLDINNCGGGDQPFVLENSVYKKFKLER